MKRTLHAIWTQDEGVLSFEWVLLATLLTVGIVSGIAGARDAIIDELADVAEAAINIDQTYTVAAFNEPPITAPGFSFTDTPTTIERCDRTSEPVGQTAEADGI
jgi:hypothetical protein